MKTSMKISIKPIIFISCRVLRLSIAQILQSKLHNSYQGVKNTHDQTIFIIMFTKVEEIGDIW